MIKCLYYLRFWIKWANRGQNLSPFNFIILLLYYKTFHYKQICWRHTGEVTGAVYQIRRIKLYLAVAIRVREPYISEHI